MGVIFLEIFHPFKTGFERNLVLKGIKEKKYPTDWVGDTVLLKKLVALSPIERASINDILVILNLSFIFIISILIKFDLLQMDAP